jgi:hypothetical protein
VVGQYRRLRNFRNMCLLFPSRSASNQTGPIFNVESAISKIMQ